MDSEVLKNFITIAQMGNITKAAQALNITQPTLSRQLKALEEELGGPLLIRGKRAVTLTENGVIFQQRAKEILSLIDKTEKEISGKEEHITGTIIIGCVQSKVSNLLAEVILGFSKQYPHVTYDLYDANADDIKDKLDWGRIDLGIVLEPVETAKYDNHMLGVKERWGVITTTDDPLADREFIQPEALTDRPLLLPRRSIVVEDIGHWLGVPPEVLNPIQTHNLLSNSLLLVKKHFGRSITIEGSMHLAHHEGLTFIPLEPERISDHVLIWKKGKVFSPATQLFIDYFKAFVDETSP